MKRLFLTLLFIPALVFSATSQKYQYATPRGMNDEMQNIYQNISQLSVSVSSTAVPSGMIAMFDASCPSGWSRFTALDNAFPYGGSTYGATGGANSITLSVGQLPAHNHVINISDPGHTHVQGVTLTGGGTTNGYTSSNFNGVVTAANVNTASATTGITATSNNTGSGNSIDIRPSYVTVVWCKKN